MIRTHSYDVTVAWTGNRGGGTSGYREYGRDHEVTVSGAGDGPEAEDADRAQPIAGSSDSAFRGDFARWNPEQLHGRARPMPHAFLPARLRGRRHCGDRVHRRGARHHDRDHRWRRPLHRGRAQARVTVVSPDMVEKAVGLHREAHERCFIANSVNFPVRHEPVVLAASTAER